MNMMYVKSAERCILCGEIIPEGREVCLSCEQDPLHRKLAAKQRMTPEKQQKKEKASSFFKSWLFRHISHN